jgi:hypothetical protein
MKEHSSVAKALVQRDEPKFIDAAEKTTARLQEFYKYMKL